MKKPDIQFLKNCIPPLGKKGGKKLGKGAKKSAPFAIPAGGIALGAGGGGLAFGVPFTGFDGVVVPGLAAAGFDYVTG